MNRWPIVAAGCLYLGWASIACAADALLLAQFPRGTGMTLDLKKLFPAIAYFFTWIYTCYWANRDCHSLRLDAVTWNFALLAGGTVGLTTLLVVESYFSALFVALLVFVTPTMIYIHGVRNPLVPDRGKVLTPDHLYYLFSLALSKVGIRLSAGDGGESVSGPPITFVGKTSGGRKADNTTVSRAEGSRGYAGAKELIYDAIIRRATDIHLEPHENEMQIRYRIDGVLLNSEPFDRTTGDAIINVIKVLSALDITEKRKPQDGSFGAELPGERKIEFRVATSGSAMGEKLVMRILDSSGGLIRLERLGMSKRMIARVHDMATQPHGLFLCSGPTGAGKSTTLYACLQEIDRFQANIITIEDPVEYRLDSITQIEIHQKSGQTFAGSLRSILRQDPDVILVGEIRDAETANTACQAAQTGHMVFSTVHANESIGTIYRLLDLGADPGNLSTSLSAILAQRLVRVLCVDCREEYRPTREIAAQFSAVGKQITALYRPPQKQAEPCPTCGGTGYRGRSGVFELLEITEKMVDMIREKASVREFKQEAKRNGAEWLQEYGLKLVAAGKTSIQELLRVVK